MQRDFPGVLDFLVEFLNTSHTQAEDVTLLKRKWLSNGELVFWENAYANTRNLLRRNQMQSDVKAQVQSLLKLTNGFATMPPRHGVLMIMNPSSSYSSMAVMVSSIDENQSAKQRFVTVRPPREIRLIERLGKQHNEVKGFVLGTLGNGAGISAVSPIYETRPGHISRTQEKRMRKDRHLISVNKHDETRGTVGTAT